MKGVKGVCEDQRVELEMRILGMASLGTLDRGQERMGARECQDTKIAEVHL